MDEFFHKTTQLLWDYKTLWEEFDEQFLNEISTVGEKVMIDLHQLGEYFRQMFSIFRSYS